MDSVFWWGIVFGGVVGFFVAIVANLSTPSFANLFTRSKLGWLERNKRKALVQYELIMRFRHGTEDKYMYFVAQWGFILFSIVMAMLMLVSAVAFIALEHRRFAVPFLVTGIYCLIRSLMLMIQLSIWYWRMNDFDSYKESVVKKWPDLQIG